MSDTTFLISGGFFDAVDSDRLYSADQMNQPYKKLIHDGINREADGTTPGFAVTAGGGMNVLVATGNAMIGGKWAENKAVQTIAVAGNTSGSARIDSIILQCDKSRAVRAVQIVYRQGTTAAPDLVSDDDIMELRLANIRVPSAVSSIASENITDTRGGAECPWVRSVFDAPDARYIVEEYTGSELAGAYQTVKSAVDSIRYAAQSGQPTVALQASDMIDSNLVYLYQGSETGYSTGYLYYYSDAAGAWIRGAQYGASVVDTALDEDSENPVQNKAIAVAIKTVRSFVVEVPGSAAAFSGSIAAGDFAKALATYTAGSGVYAVKDGEVYQLSAASSSTMTFTQMYHGTMNFIKQIQITSADTFTVTNTALSSSAADTSYNNTTSGLTATDVQAAIDENAAAVTNVNGRLGDVEADLNNVLEISNTASGTVSVAQSWEIFHYTIKAGRTYTLHNDSASATMSAYTRESEEGANIDLIGTVGTNQSKTFTASANANFLRIISTQAETPWSVEEHGTKIYDMDADINTLETDKLDKVVYENKITETVVPSGTWVNFPFKMTEGHTYICTPLTIGNTMSFYTRANEEGPNIDFCGTVAYGAQKMLTATADANYIRANSYLANGAFKIEDTGTASYRIDELQPKTPVVNLPSKLYATSGKELNVYFDNIVENAERYTYDITCAKGKQMQRGYSIIPEDADAGTYDFTLNVLNNELEIVTTATATLAITASHAGSGVTKSFILLGDSTVNGTDTQIVNNFDSDDMSVSSLGTRGAAPASHEGRTGWMFQYYYNSASIGGITNPFYNPTSHLFDANYYFANSGIAKPDWFFIQLGINDVFLPTDDDALNSKIKSMVTQCNYIINSIKSASPTTKIGVAVTIPPNHSQDAFGKAYGCGQTRARYKHNNMAWVKKLLTEYTGREADNIYLIPICTNLDTTYNMGLESMPVNARNTGITYQSPIANGGVHPVESGYKQLADVYVAFIKAVL